MRNINILLSFKGIFASLVYEGKKIYEIRKSKILNIIPNMSRAYIYETIPKGRITGLFIIGHVSMTNVKDSLDKFVFDSATKKYVEAISVFEEIFVIEVLTPYKFEVTVDPSNIKGFVIPQSFRYLTTQEVDMIDQYNRIKYPHFENKVETLEEWL